MLAHFFKIALRHAAKYRGYTFITIFGMALGLATSIIILLSVYDQLTFDNFHTNKDQIYQVQQTVHLESGEYISDRTGGAYAESLLQGFPEIKKVTRYGNAGELLISKVESDKYGESYIEDNVWAADSSFFEIFSFNFIIGNPQSALDKPGSVVLNTSTAVKYFGNNWQENPNILGASLQIDHSMDLVVTGVVNIPGNSHIQFDFILTFPLLRDLGYYIDGFEGTMYNTYLLIENGASPDNINSKITEYIQSQFEPVLESQQFIVPLEKVYLHGESNNYITIYAFAAIAIMILCIACINFVNLSTAMSINRTTEVGIRKVEGASRMKLTNQFLGEVFLTIIVSTQLALILVEIFLPEYNRLTESNLYINYLDPKFMLGIGALIVITTLLAGLYPALILSSNSPSQLLKQKGITSKRGSILRKILVITQFTFTSFFLIVTVIMIRQFSYMDSADPGFDEENVIFLPVRGETTDNYEIIKEELLKSSNILSVTSASDIPSFVQIGDVGWGVADNRSNSTLARVLFVGYDFDKTFNIAMKEGRFFSQDFQTDTSSIIVNQEALDVLGINDPIGTKFHFWDDTYTIIGVVETFSFFPFKIGGKALIMPFQPVDHYLFIKATPGNPTPVIEHAKSVLSQFNPGFPFEYHFLEDFRPDVLSKSGVINRLMIYFNFFGIFISCLGLVGLATFTAEQKSKEIGIRKVFGASASRIAYLLSGSFIKLVILANLISIPFAWLAMEATLSFFIQRIKLSPLIFFLVMLFTVGVAIVTVSWKSIAAAIQNPIESLRYE